MCSTLLFCRGDISLTLHNTRLLIFHKDAPPCLRTFTPPFPLSETYPKPELFLSARSRCIPPLRSPERPQNFSKDTADILLLVVARLSVLPLIAFLAATKGKPPNAAPATTASGADDASDGNSSRAGRGRTNQVAGKRKYLWRRVCSCFGYG